MADTDRELLELAAKAAGYALCTWPDESGLRAEIEPNWRPLWNPLTSDGDALRLAVKLGLEVSVAYAQAYACPFGTPRGRELNEPFGDVHGAERQDRFAATRRVIVRAAAELGRAAAIGKEMP